MGGDDVGEVAARDREEDDVDGKETWGLYYVDESFVTALELIDSALLTIDRGK